MTLTELNAIKERVLAKSLNRRDASPEDIKIVVGMATCGVNAGAREVLNAFTEEVEKTRTQKRSRSSERLLRRLQRRTRLRGSYHSRQRSRYLCEGTALYGCRNRFRTYRERQRRFRQYNSRRD